ncbi:MAG: hypothetical protein K9G76_11935 [Bacteroidales bacterium]|nr:hypothetical protein [Bacteroidales bacterium]MCF8405153.1 hypothetical protein [Bacteroidales bacterium]
MKKGTVILAALLFFVCFANTQDFKPVAGDLGVELNFTPLSATPIGINYLKARYYLANDLVVRIGLDIRMHSEKGEPMNEIDPLVTDEEKASYTQFGIFPGIEKHFGNWERFSPYVGAEVGFTTKGAKSEYIDNNVNQTMEVNGAWDQFGTQRGFTSIGINALCGADFYFTKKIYLGAEIGFGVLSTSMKEVEITAAGASDTIINKESRMDLGFNFNPAIRLGFCF